jgi:hypothetical protein
MIPDAGNIILVTWSFRNTLLIGTFAALFKEEERTGFWLFPAHLGYVQSTSDAFWYLSEFCLQLLWDFALATRIELHVGIGKRLSFFGKEVTGR